MPGGSPASFQDPGQGHALSPRPPAAHGSHGSGAGEGEQGGDPAAMSVPAPCDSPACHGDAVLLQWRLHFVKEHSSRHGGRGAHKISRKGK